MEAPMFRGKQRAGAVVAAAAMFLAATRGDEIVNLPVVSSGGSAEASGSLGVVGQFGPAAAFGGGFELAAGDVPCWAVPAGPPSDGDFDGDGDRDIADFVSFCGCMAGPDRLAASNCTPGDFDADGDVDLADFSEFQKAFEGAR